MVRNLLAGVCCTAMLATSALAQSIYTPGPGAPPSTGSGGSGCTVAGTVNQVVVNNGSTGCSSSATTITTGGAATIPVASAASAPALMTTGAIFTGGSGTTTFPHVLIQPSTATASTTWSTTGTAFGVNAHTGIGNLLDLQLDGVDSFKVQPAGNVTANGNLTLGTTGSLTLGAAGIVAWNGRGTMTSPASASVQIGSTDNTTATAQTLRVQSVIAGNSNVAGANWTVVGSLSTGSGVSGDVIFQTGGTGAGATVQNTATTAMTIKGASQLIQLNAITTDATHTDASVCEDTTTHALYSGSGTLGICLGTSSARYKHDITDLAPGLDAILNLRPVSYYLNADHGDAHKQLYGFTAEDMQKVLPKLVDLDTSGQPNTADYLGLIPVLVKAVQEQQAEIEALKTRLTDRQVVATINAR